MVERLAERLKKDGSDVPGWVQLVRSYRVLGKADKVKIAIADARAALASDQEALQRLDQGLVALDTERAPPVPPQPHRPTLHRKAERGEIARRRSIMAAPSRRWSSAWPNV